MMCLTVEIIIKSKIIPHTPKIQHMSIITPYLNFLKRLVFADDTTLQAKHPYRQNAIREVFSWACSNKHLTSKWRAMP